MLVAQLLRRALRAGLVEVEDGDAGAVPGEEPCGRETDPARAGRS